MIVRRNRRRTARRYLGVSAVAGTLAAVLTALSLQPSAAVQTPTEPPAEPQTGSSEQTPGEAYADLGFGVFMHYGLATFEGRTPWNYDPHNVEATVYDPPDFDADQWMRAVKASGAKYIMLTTKHHDGFTMWPSDYTDYGVHTSSDPDTDVVGEAVRAARENGLEVGFYYSWYDKLHPGGNVVSEPPSAEYIQYAKNHLHELLTEYGPVAAIWLDTPVHAREAGISEYIHSVSPDTAFIWKNYASGRHMGDYPDADVRTFEGPTPEMMPCGYDEMPAEQAYNVAGGPGWWEMSPDAIPRGDVDEAVSTLAYTQHAGAALTLNVSPGPTGQISPANVRLLEGIGDRVRGDDLLADAATSASGEAGEHPADDATDLLAKTYWQVPADGDSAWLQVDLAEPMTIDKTAAQFTGDDVSGYEIQYADGDGNWHPAHAGGVPAIPTQTDEFAAVTTDSLRLVVDNAGADVGVAEFKAYGGIDDTNPAVTYDGSGWQQLDRPAGAPQVPRLPPSVPFTDASNQSVHRSRTAGDTATVTFTGNAVRLHAGVGPDQGIAEVSVDGGAAETIDFYRSEPGRDVAVFERGGLDPGEHTLTIEVTGEHNDDATGSWVTLDRVIPLDLPEPFDPGEPFDELPDGRIIYDDSGDACGQGSQIEYSGNWRASTWSGTHRETRHHSNGSGDSAEFTFEGTGVEFMTQLRPGHGIAAISLDGGPAEQVDTYSANPQEQVVAWEKTGLEPGEHTVRVTVTGEKNPASINTWLVIDAFIITP